MAARQQGHCWCRTIRIVMLLKKLDPPNVRLVASIVSRENGIRMLDGDCADVGGTSRRPLCPTVAYADAACCADDGGVPLTFVPLLPAGRLYCQAEQWG
jgi:hypothetical protein